MKNVSYYYIYTITTTTIIYDQLTNYDGGLALKSGYLFGRVYGSP